MIRKSFALAFTAAVLASCSGGGDTHKKEKKTVTAPVAVVRDEHTLSNADSVDMKHLDLDINVDMAKKQITGSATWTIDNKKKVKVLRLDTYDLSIDTVWVDGKITPGYWLDAQSSFMGKALHIPVADGSQSVKVAYKTGPGARALQWLDPQQTHDKRYPFLFTQSESIYARSWIPCPDGPGIRFSYSATVHVPAGLLALMSASNPQAINNTGVYHFEMTTPIPAYLMALAVGDIVFKPVDERSGVYAERGMIDAVSYEFVDIGRMVNVAEQLYGPYRWERYDVIVLPPGFPIGGMENPRLTFCTPTVIAGDRSLVSLIAHELAHSWSGNLVTNATWNDFWLNEGFTVYFERRIMEQMQGKDYADMLWELGYQDFARAVQEIGPRDTWLKLDLKGRDPDDGLNDIAYEKGALLLRLIEENVGRDKFDHFLNDYFSKYAFHTITTEAFISYLDSALLKDNSVVKEKINLKAWVYGPGIPNNCPRVDMVRFNKVDSERDKFLNDVPAAQLQTTDWTTHEWLHFLRKMPPALSAAQMKQLDHTFNFTSSGNSEIADLWFIMAVRANYSAAYANMDRFLSAVGRRKFLEPLYREMMKTPQNAVMARRIYAKYRKNYHPLTQEGVDKIVK